MYRIAATLPPLPTPNPSRLPSRTRPRRVIVLFLCWQAEFNALDSVALGLAREKKAPNFGQGTGMIDASMLLCLIASLLLCLVASSFCFLASFPVLLLCFINSLFLCFFASSHRKENRIVALRPVLIASTPATPASCGKYQPFRAFFCFFQLFPPVDRKTSKIGFCFPTSIVLILVFRWS